MPKVHPRFVAWGLLTLAVLPSCGGVPDLPSMGSRPGSGGSDSPDGSGGDTSSPSTGGAGAGTNTGGSAGSGAGSVGGQSQGGESSVVAPNGTSLSVEVRDEAGELVVGAKVTLDGTEQTTDNDGTVIFEGLTAGKAVAQVTAEGFAPTSAVADLETDVHAGAIVTLTELGTPVAFDTSVESEVVNDGVTVDLPASSIVDQDGNPVTGLAAVRIAAVDPSDSANLAKMPGPLEGTAEGSSETQPLETLFMAEISLWSDDQQLQLAQGSSATVELPLPEGLGDQYAAGDVVPAWHFDLESGLWVQEGSGVVGQDESGNLYWSVEVGHFSWWSAAKTITTSCLDVTVKDSQGNPLSGLPVLLNGTSYYGLNSTYTGTSGEACISAKAGAAAELSAGFPGYSTSPVSVTLGSEASECGGSSCQAVTLTVATECTPGSYVTCNSGALGRCELGVSACNGVGMWNECKSVLDAIPEDCSTSDDDNCDGQVNEECACTPGETRDCYEGAAFTLGVGACVGGTQTCDSAGFGWSECQGQVLPTDETCDTEVDDDCDGYVNEEGKGCLCVQGTYQDCYSGPEGSAGVGQCAKGQQYCAGQGYGYTECYGEVLPAAEDCNTAWDDNCDGEINENCVCNAGELQECYSGPEKTKNVGICYAGTHYCESTGLGFSQCDGEVVPSTEDCSTELDENCDGQINEGCACAPAEVYDCYSGPEGTKGVGVCSGGYQVCESSGTGFSACEGETVPAVKDDCTTLEDENCDGTVNDGCVCFPGDWQYCYEGPDGTYGIGTCSPGYQVCNADGLGWGTCADQIVPEASDDCSTYDDENCDGEANEKCECEPDDWQECYSGSADTVWMGACHPGYQLCEKDGFGSCNAEVTPTTEDCDTPEDDDCDGLTNEGCACDPATWNPWGDNGGYGGKYDGSYGGHYYDPGYPHGGKYDTGSYGGKYDSGYPYGGKYDAGYAGGYQSPPTGSGTAQPTNTNTAGAGGADAAGTTDPTKGSGGYTYYGSGGGYGQGYGGGSYSPPGSTGDWLSCYTGPNTTRWVGACHDGYMACSDAGVLDECEGQVVPSDELCDGVDNDCDGEIDEELADCECMPGSYQWCYSGADGTAGVGQCWYGYQWCASDGTEYGASWSSCEYESVPTDETCNGLDDDCDGTADDGVSCACNADEWSTCYSGPPGTEGVGLCYAGWTQCASDGSAWGLCDWEGVPQSEVCDGYDNDCDGVVDNGLDCSCMAGAWEACYTASPHTEGVGECHSGWRQCSGDGKAWGACEYEQVPQDEPPCSLIDTNCDGKVNDGSCACEPGSLAECYTGPQGSDGVGQCGRGFQECSTDGKGYGACQGEILPEAAENCGTDWDDDCDGQVNEGCSCTPGATIDCYSAPKSSANVGACHTGLMDCTASGQYSGTCWDEVTPVTEDCSTPEDDDCDGMINEDCECVPGSLAECYTGPDATLGVGACHSGWKACDDTGHYGLCTDERVPEKVENCSTAEDDDCNPSTTCQ